MKQSLLYSTIATLLLATCAFSQVGINTFQPKADLEIVSDAAPGTNKYNGVIIPKVTALPVSGEASFPTADQSGLMLYLNTTDATKGIYMFDGTKYVKIGEGSLSSAFFSSGTTNFSSSSTEDVYRTGKVNIGSSSFFTGTLNVNNVTTNSSTPTGLRLINSNTSTATSTNFYGIFSENNSTGNGVKYGIRTDVSAAGTGNHVGIQNNVLDNSSAAAGSVIGIENIVGTVIGTGTGIENYGIKSTIGSATSSGPIYGIYSEANGTTAGKVYAGLFNGKLGVGNVARTTGYDLPTDRGTSGQVLTTDGNGQATWQAASSRHVSLWQGGTYLAKNLNALTDLTGIQSILPAFDVNASGELEVKLVLWVTQYADITEFEVKGINSLGVSSFPIQQADLTYVNNGSGGMITSSWKTFSAGPSSTPSQFILRGRVLASGGGGNNEAQIISAYLMVRPKS